MLQINASSTKAYCDGLSRRNFVKLGVAGMANLGLGGFLRAVHAGESSTIKDTSVILIWLDGGPSHLDLYDLKPEAPAEYRGIWNPIKTNVPGMEISELFPLQAKVADKFSIIRSLYHDDGDHFAAAHLILTSRPGATGADQQSRYPGIGAIASKLAGPRQPGMPAHVAVPYAASVGNRPGYFGANYLGRQYDPFEPNGNPNNDKYNVENLNLAAGLSVQRLDDRRELQKHFDRVRRDADASRMMETIDRFDQSAYELVVSPAARKAFDMSSEDPRIRELYGRNEWGQSTLLARRLVEAGSRFVTVHMGGWDHHWDLQAGMESLLPRVDQAVHGLLTDLASRGLWEKTLVMVCGEFSRTPRMNDGSGKGTPGRDHWGNAMFCVMGGGGVKGGQIVGSTDRLGERPKDRPLRPGDIHHTIYHVLGVDPKTSFLNHSGRPVPAVDEGAVIQELV
jgi:Protein of unknown function (DUF1501)